MSTQQHDRPAKPWEKPPPEHLTAAISRQVMHALGEPAGLHRVLVRHLWGRHYRVNVLVGEDAASARVAYSYFLVADEEGHVLAATPTITRQC
jgi:hypothetical protein